MTASKQKVTEFGANRTLHIRLDDKYWQVLFAMTQMAGQTPEDYAKETIQFDIKSLLDDSPEYFGKLLCDGWRETLEKQESH